MTVFDLIRPARTDVISRRQSFPDRRGRTLRNGVEGHADAVDQREAIYCLSQYRKTFPWAAITCPADALRWPEVTSTARKRGQIVDVGSYDELTAALSAGIAAQRITMHDDRVTAAPIRCGVAAGVGRLVIGCCQQVDILASCTQLPQRVLVDVTSSCAEAALTAVGENRRLDLIGLHTRLMPAASTSDYVDAAARMIGQMALIRRARNIILTRVSLACADSPVGATPSPAILHARAVAIDEAFDDVCARFRFPRPALVLAPWESQNA